MSVAEVPPLSVTVYTRLPPSVTEAASPMATDSVEAAVPSRIVPLAIEVPTV